MPNKEIHATVKLDGALNDFIGREARKSVRSKRQQILFMLLDYMRIQKENQKGGVEK